MPATVIKLKSLIHNLEHEEVLNIVSSFKGLNVSEAAHDVEEFIHSKAIEFEKFGISTTYLVFDEETGVLLGFFSLANKPLTMGKKNFDKLSSNQRRTLKKSGREVDSKFQINSYLIGQLGKNYSKDAIESKTIITGKELLTLAYDKVIEASNLITAKFIWIECDDIKYLDTFYRDFGFVPIENYRSESNLIVMILKIT